MAFADLLAWWSFALPAVGFFYFTYGLAEEFIRNRRKPAKSSEAKPSIAQTSETQPTCCFDWPQPAHGYDTPELFRKDALRHIQENDRAVAQYERNIQNTY